MLASIRKWPFARKLIDAEREVDGGQRHRHIFLTASNFERSRVPSQAAPVSRHDAADQYRCDLLLHRRCELICHSILRKMHGPGAGRRIAAACRCQNRAA
jgi:hypothetical protein